jgi:hypothetical protein
MMNKFYGDAIRWFVGICECTSDPLHLGRVRVRIYGVHSDNTDEVPESSLPWAATMTPTTEDGVSGLGRNSNLKPGAMVFGMFTDGHVSQQPMVLGSLPRIESLDTEQNTTKNNDAPKVQTQNVPNTKTSTEAPSRGTNAYTKGLVGSDNVEKAFNFLISNGYRPVPAAAIIGNFMKESQGEGQGIRPNAINPTSESYGIAQWNPQPAALRKQELVAWANDRRLRWDTGNPGSPNDVEALLTQLQFFHWDFSTRRADFYNYVDVFTSNNVSLATQLFMDGYERPGAAEADLPQRIKYAKQTLETYG